MLLQPANGNNNNSNNKKKTRGVSPSCIYISVSHCYHNSPCVLYVNTISRCCCSRAALTSPPPNRTDQLRSPRSRSEQTDRQRDKEREKEKKNLQKDRDRDRERERERAGGCEQAAPSAAAQTLVLLLLLQVVLLLLREHLLAVSVEHHNAHPSRPRQNQRQSGRPTPILTQVVRVVVGVRG